MRSDTTQLDILRDDPARIAQAHHVYADTWLHNPYFPEDECKRRYEHYMAEADKIQRSAR